jgi:hypothetical protein
MLWEAAFPQYQVYSENSNSLNTLFGIMAVGMQGGAPEPPALSIHPIDFRTDPDTIRAGWRVTGGLLIVAGTPYLATTVLDSIAGNLGRALFAAIVAAALFIGGTSLLAQRYSAGPDTARRSGGIVGLAMGPGLIFNSLQNISGGVGSGTDPLTLLSVVSLVLGCALVVSGATFIWSRRYAAWYQRRWEKSQRRRSERLRRRR